MDNPATMSEITPGWWVSQSRLYHTHSGLFTSGDDAILIDPGIYPDEIEAIAAFVKAHAIHIQAVLLTHSHWDHILGPEHFPEATLIAHQCFAITAAEAECELHREIAGLEKDGGASRRRAFRIPHPDITFDRRMTLQVGSELIQLVAAPGHAPDQLIAYQPNGQTLWAADMLSDLEIPLIQSSLSAYRQTMEMLDSLRVRTLIPGHGFVTCQAGEIAARLASDRVYLAELDSRTREAVELGLTLEESVRLCHNIPYRQDREENAGPHRLNSEAAYVEAGGSAPVDSGWNRKA